jgi:hypothetical protein
MTESMFWLGVVVVWIVAQTWLLPRLGVPT